MIEKFKNIFIIILLCALAVFQFSAHTRDQKLQKLQVENFKLNDKLKSIVQVDGNKVVVVTKTQYITKYIPPESNTTITTGKDDKIKLEYNNFDTGFYPFLGVGYSDGVKPLLGARFLYWSRFGLGVSTSFDGLNLFIDTRTDWKYFENSSFSLFYGSNKNIGLGIHTFF